MFYYIGFVFICFAIYNFYKCFKSFINMRKESKERILKKQYYTKLFEDKNNLNATLYVSLFVLLLFLIPIILLNVRKFDDNELPFFIGSIIFFLYSKMLGWYEILKKEKFNLKLKERNTKIKEPFLKKYFNLYYKYILAHIGLIIICCFSAIYVFNYDFHRIEYHFNAPDVSRLVEAEYIPAIEKYLRTDKIPDLQVEVKQCRFKEIDVLNSPIYEIKFKYSSEKIDELYESYLNNNLSKKDFFTQIQVVNLKNILLEAKDQYRDIISKICRENRIKITIKNIDSDLIIKSKNHTYKILESYADCLWVDNQKIYHYEITPSIDYNPKPTKPKPQKPSEPSQPPSYIYPSTPTHSSYNDGYHDVICDHDYDRDRYYNDDDYRNGVEDAFDELDLDY